MPSEDIEQRISDIEQWKAGTDVKLQNLYDKMSEYDQDCRDCRTSQKNSIDEINRKLDLIKSNELTHLELRLKDVEGRKRDPISWSDIIKIVIAVVAASASVIVAFVQYWR